LWAFDSGLKQKPLYKKPVQLVQAVMQATAGRVSPASVVALLEVQEFKAKDAGEGTKLCIAAAEKGDLQLLQWLRTHDCAWNADTCREAAVHGHLDVLI
jgi:hypothetical protein